MPPIYGQQTVTTHTTHTTTSMSGGYPGAPMMGFGQPSGMYGQPMVGGYPGAPGGYPGGYGRSF